MKKAIKVLTGTGVAAKIIIGVVPVTWDSADKIGADGCGADSAAAADLAEKLIARIW